MARSQKVRYAPRNRAVGFLPRACSDHAYDKLIGAFKRIARDTDARVSFEAREHDEEYWTAFDLDRVPPIELLQQAHEEVSYAVYRIRVCLTEGFIEAEVLLLRDSEDDVMLEWRGIQRLETDGAEYKEYWPALLAVIDNVGIGRVGTDGVKTPLALTRHGLPRKDALAFTLGLHQAHPRVVNTLIALGLAERGEDGEAEIYPEIAAFNAHDTILMRSSYWRGQGGMSVGRALLILFGVASAAAGVLWLLW